MPRKGHSEEKIVFALRQVEAGKKVSEVCRERGVSPQAFCSCKRRYAAGGAPAARRKREVEGAGGRPQFGPAHFAGGAVQKS